MPGLTPFGLMKAVGTVLGIPQEDIQILKNDLKTIQEKCREAGIQANPDAYNHSLGVPIGTEVLDSIGPTDPIQVGERFNFGGPTQPPGAHNYVGTRDIVPWLNLINVVTAICTGFRDIEFMDSSGQSPLGAHSFLGPTYQKALQDSFHNSGNSNE